MSSDIDHNKELSMKVFSSSGLRQKRRIMIGMKAMPPRHRQQYSRMKEEATTTVALSSPQAVGLLGTKIQQQLLQIDNSRQSGSSNNNAASTSTMKCLHGFDRRHESWTNKEFVKKAKTCSFDECTNIVVRGGVCRRHGAKVEVKRCSTDGCTNKSVRGGVCIRHGATWTRKRCSSEGCTNVSLRGGVCRRHGAKKKLCSWEGCTNVSLRRGVCMRHGAKKKLCSSERCTNATRKGGVCRRHGAKIEYKRCSIK